ncbi:sulfite reductase alpha subunit-like flavoprotein [Mycobacteroides chelonae]|nr:sulfite reductase alpha subunit-like flavoprotein [Mycobacteroides chelonae]
MPPPTPASEIVGDRLAAQRAGRSDALLLRSPASGSRLPVRGRVRSRSIKYVQDRIAVDADDIWDLLGDPAKQTHVYVCGDGGKMAPAVREAFVDIYRRHTGAAEPQARNWLTGLVEADRYVEDVWTE